MASTALLVAPAVGSFGVLAWFGDTGNGPGRIGPHAPALAVDAGGRVYVVDAHDDRIEAFAPGGAPDGGWDVADPAGIAAAPDGTLIVSGADGVWRYEGDGTALEQLSQIADPGAVAALADGTVAVVDAERDTVALLGAGELPAVFSNPVGVAAAADGSVFVADGAGQVHAFSPSLEAAGSWPAGSPQGIAAAPDGTLLVTDGGEHVVRRYDTAGTLVETFGSAEETAHLNNPRGVGTDCRGSVYVVDNSERRVHVYGDPDLAPPPCIEPEPTPEPTPTPTPDPPAKIEVAPAVVESEPEPLLGVRGRATAVSGSVLVGKKGKLRPLSGRELIPVGTLVDATNGRVKLEFETAAEDRPTYGRFGEGEFFDGAFTVHQSPNSSLVTLDLLEDLETPSGSPSRARAAAKKRLKVWGKAKGKFRTRGRNGAATVLGTQWLTEERPDGTLFRVREGTVGVKDFSTGRTIILEAGDSYLAKPPCTSRRKFRIRLRVPYGAVVRDAVVRVRGKRVAVRRGKRLTAPVDLRGVPKRTVRVRITLRLADGSVLSGVRLYRTCSPTSAPATPPPL